jgi:sugar O-acyltransferase (sialic acid O-acetyltransferase NeuD family)
MFAKLGGNLMSIISPQSNIGNFGVRIGDGVNLMTGTTVTNDVEIGTGSLINLHCTIGHDSILGEFVELSPGVHVSGNCTIGDFCNIGTNAVLLPKITLGENVIVGAGAVVTKDVPPNSLVVGLPAKVVKELSPIFRKNL